MPRYKIEYAINIGALTEPALRVANKRAFALKEAQAVAEYFGVTISIGDDADKGEKGLSF